MSKKEKLIKRLKSNPKDMTYNELVTLLGLLSYRISNKGKTSGSRIMFTSDGHQNIVMHKPHPENTIPSYVIKELLAQLEREELI